MMGGVRDWGERKKEIGIFFKNCFTGLERHKPSYMSKGLFYPQLKKYFRVNQTPPFKKKEKNTKHLKK